MRNKYNAKKIVTPDGTFDSKSEFKRYCALHNLALSGDIRKLERQVRFDLLPAKKGEFRAERPVYYTADFVYEEKRGDMWARVVEDVKGKKTKDYVLRRKLMLAVHGISIKEVKV